jgi:aldehyde:ferredoxin oxidoreductase
MPYGYHGKILHVDLTNSSLKVERPEENFYRKYLGGSALGLYYALKKIPPKADPLGPENILILALSVLTGVPISGQRMNETIVKQRTTCFGCALRCKREVEVTDGPFPINPRYGAPEYETVSTFGSYCSINDLKAISKANEICNK